VISSYHRTLFFDETSFVEERKAVIASASDKSGAYVHFPIRRRPKLHKLNRNPPSYHRRRPLQAGKRNVAFRIEQPVNLGSAGLEQSCHLVLGNFLFLHGLGELPRNHLFHSLRLCLFKDTFFLEEIVNARTHMLLAHRSNSFGRFRAPSA
jgi:hypothetical protein